MEKMSEYEIKIGEKLDEDWNPPSLPENAIENLIFDFNDVIFLNSTGIGLWVRWMMKIHEGSNVQKMTFKRVPRIVINQINSVKDFLPENARVKSFYLPIYCNESDKQYDVLLEADSTTREKVENLSPEILGTEFKNIDDLEVDVIPEKYLKFIKD